MSDDWAIRVEGLGKRYSIAADRGRYTSLRDVLSQGARKAASRLLGRGGGTPAREPFWALRDVSFEVPRGEVVGIIGRNGAGKSTLLKILSRITEPTEGEVDIHGRVGSLLEVGTGFHPELTGRENVYLNGAILGMKRTEIVSKFDEIVAFAEVERFIDTPVKHYSSGMYMRLAFGVAAHLEPEILVVDEVLSVGDAAFQKKCMGKMEDVADQGRTVLFVSHNMPALLQICSRAIILQQGCVVDDGPVSSVVQKYLANKDLDQLEVCDLRAIPRTLHTNENARLVNCRLTTPSKSNAWALPFGDQIQLAIEIEVTRSVCALELGLALNTATDFEVASSLSIDAIDALNLNPGTYTFDVAFPGLTLAPGRYYFGLGLRANRGMEDHLPEAVSFEVMPNTESSVKLVHLRRGSIIPELRIFFEKPVSLIRQGDNYS